MVQENIISSVDSESKEDTIGITGIAQNNVDRLGSTIYPVGSVVWAKVKDIPWWPSIVIGDHLSSEGQQANMKHNFCQVSTLGLNPTSHLLHVDHISLYLSSFDFQELSRKTRTLRNDNSKVPKEMWQPFRRAILDANELRSVRSFSERIERFSKKFAERRYALPEDLARTLHFELKPQLPLVWKTKPSNSLSVVLENKRKRKLGSKSNFELRQADLSDDTRSVDTSDNGSVSDLSVSEDGKVKKKMMKSLATDLVPVKVFSTLEALNKDPLLKDSCKSKSKERFPKRSADDRFHLHPVDWSEILQNPPFYKTNVCVVCEMSGELLICRNCVLFYHRSCYVATYQDPDVGEAENFTCKECRHNEVFCFVCMEEIEGPKTEDTVLFCSVKLCRKFYHKKCLNKYKLPSPDSETDGAATSDGVVDLMNSNNAKFVCPQHVCASCYVADPHDLSYSKGKFIKCLRCPLAYHTQNDDSCLPAGSNVVSSSYLVCPLHFRIPTKRVNVNWCFFCASGGELVCCEFCPAAFHQKCLASDENLTSKNGWLCENCRCGSLPKYGDVVWAKLAQFRWWPAQVVHPWAIPDTVLRVNSRLGEYVVHFFGTYNFSWLPGHRVFLFEENDDKTKCMGSKTLDNKYATALKEATVAYKAYCMRNEEKIVEAQRKLEDNAKRPPPFKYLPQNRPVYPVKMQTCAVSENSVCTCKPSDPNPCGPDSNCMNRITQYECHPLTCPVGPELCQNQRFRNFCYVPTEVFKSDQKGWGLKTTEDIRAGLFVGEYCGELIDRKECNNRVMQQNLTHNYNFYFCVLDRDRVIDASKKGNHLRFINHSCDPNCTTQVWTVNGDQRVGVFAMRDIEAGSELTFNYNLESLGETRIRCFCRAPSCSGYIGQKSKTVATVLEEARAKKATSAKAGGKSKNESKRRTSNSENSHDDFCFVCGEGGELLMCGRSACPKVYHPKCVDVKQSAVLKSKWICPCHYCNVCAKKSNFSCCNCPSSACEKHSKGFIFVTDLKLGTFTCAKCLESKETSQELEQAQNGTVEPMSNVTNVDLDKITSKCLASLSENIAAMLSKNSVSSQQKVNSRRTKKFCFYSSDSEGETDSNSIADCDQRCQETEEDIQDKNPKEIKKEPGIEVDQVPENTDGAKPIESSQCNIKMEIS